jgi:hypothetical protein
MTTVHRTHAATATARTAATSPLKPAYGTSPEKDLTAISAHLGKNWSVTVANGDAKSLNAVRTSIEGLVKKNGLDVERFRALAAKKPGDSAFEQLNRAVFAYGVLAGERYAFSQQGNQIDLINRLREIKSRPPLADLPVVKPLDFGSVADQLTRTVAKGAGLKAEPNGWAAYKKTADEYDEPGPDAKGFKGRPLHFSLGASIGGFGDTTSKATVFYNHVRNRTPLNTLVSAVFRQGMNLGVLTLDKPLDAAVNKALAEAGNLGVVGGRTGDRFDR